MSKISFPKMPRIDYAKQFLLAKLELYAQGIPVELTEEEWKKAEEKGFVTVEKMSL